MENKTGTHQKFREDLTSSNLGVFYQAAETDYNNNNNNTVTLMTKDLFIPTAQH